MNHNKISLWKPSGIWIFNLKIWKINSNPLRIKMWRFSALLLVSRGIFVNAKDSLISIIPWMQILRININLTNKSSNNWRRNMPEDEKSEGKNIYNKFCIVKKANIFVNSNSIFFFFQIEIFWYINTTKLRKDIF